MHHEAHYAPAPVAHYAPAPVAHYAHSVPVVANYAAHHVSPAHYAAPIAQYSDYSDNYDTQYYEPQHAYSHY